jgi:TonB family protein
MLFCQACGARNVGDARFCNMCGKRIAQTGEPGGPIASRGAPAGRDDRSSALDDAAAAAAMLGGVTGGATSDVGTTTTMSGSRVSLESIGVRSSTKTYALLIGGGLFLFLLGGIGMWLAMRPGDAEVAAVPPPRVDAVVAPAVPDEPIEVGDPVTAGEAVPEGVDIVAGTPRATKRAGGARAPGAAPAGGAGAGGAAAGAGGAGGGAGSGAAAGAGSGAAAGAGAPRPGGSSASATGAGTSGASAGGSGSTAAAGSGGAAAGGAGGEGSAPAGGAAGSGATPERDWDAMEAPEDPEEVAMENYGLHVRRVIREFYIRRAQTCFDHESRVDGNPVRGTVLIGFTIEESGQVSNTTVDRNTTGRDALGQCLASQVDQWRLPPPPTEVGATQMQMPFGR